jgi:hypothetical protein
MSNLRNKSIGGKDIQITIIPAPGIPFIPVLFGGASSPG